MSKKTILFSTGILAIAILAALAVLFQADGQMAFPKTPHGDFVQEPALILDRQERMVEWTLPANCADASYEVQGVDYKRDSEMLWGGQKTSCNRTENGYHCQAAAHPGMEGEEKRWVIQAYGYECDDGKYYVSEVITTS